ncbi:hypothetical protein ACFMBG_09115 [Leisingera sp. D0M16]|uniref:hypothetical protein n=1 Tax=Leisingera coralii TaxID=3351347 RepID=UPI003B7E4CDA
MIVRQELRCDLLSSIGSCSEPERQSFTNGKRAANGKIAAAMRPLSSPRADLKFQLTKTNSGLWQVLDANCACGGVFRDRISATRFIRQELAGVRSPVVYVLIGSAEDAGGRTGL